MNKYKIMNEGKTLFKVNTTDITKSKGLKKGFKKVVGSEGDLNFYDYSPLSGQIILAHGGEEYEFTYELIKPVTSFF